MLIAYYLQADGRIYRADDVTNIDRKALNRRIAEYNEYNKDAVPVNFLDAAPPSFVRIVDVSDDSLTAYLFRRDIRNNAHAVAIAREAVDSLKDALRLAEDWLDAVKHEEETT